MQIAGGVGIAKKLNVGGNLVVQGSVTGNGAYSSASDRRLKLKVKQLVQAMEKLRSLRGVRFQWNRDEFPSRNFEEGEQVGFIAQEVEEVIPEVVRTQNDGFKSVQYTGIIPFVVEAQKLHDDKLAAHDDKIVALEQKIVDLERQNSELAGQVQQLLSTLSANA